MTIAQVQAGEDRNEKTVQLAKLLTEIGPDIPEISRRLGQFKESVRYRYKEKVLGTGMAVQAAVDHEKLGLRRVVMTLDFAPEYRGFADSILASMNELLYLVSFSKVLPSGDYVAELTAPADMVEGLQNFFFSLKEKGMLTKLEFYPFEWFRVAPMKCENYDFTTGRWEYDWTNPGSTHFESARMMPSNPEKFDFVDLRIMEQLQMDANKSLKEIADEIGVHYKKLAWHYSTHVMARHLLKGFTIRWMGTGYDYKADKAMHKQHRYLALQLLVRDVNELEMIKLRESSNKIPFLWNEAIGRNYFATYYFPVDLIVEGMQWLTTMMSDVRDRAVLLTIDQTAAISFAIPNTLFDPKLKKWMFEPLDLAQRFDNLILQIKGGVSRNP